VLQAPGDFYVGSFIRIETVYGMRRPASCSAATRSATAIRNASIRRTSSFRLEYSVQVHGFLQSDFDLAMMELLTRTMTNQAVDSLEARVLQIIAETQKIPQESVSIDKTFQDLNIDSLDGINIIFALESEFDITIPDEGVENMKSVRDAVDGVRQLVEQKVAADPQA
jgi:acyl carrier protein